MSARSDDKAKDAAKPKKRRIRGAMGRKAMQIGILRRWYIRRVLRFIDRSKEKRRPLPEGMAETARFLSRVPKHQREKFFEDAILGQQNIPSMGREYRRAASRQRRSGKNEANFRPGRPPGAARQVKGRPR